MLFLTVGRIIVTSCFKLDTFLIDIAALQEIMPNGRLKKQDSPEDSPQYAIDFAVEKHSWKKTPTKGSEQDHFAWLKTPFHCLSKIIHANMKNEYRLMEPSFIITYLLLTLHVMQKSTVSW